VAAASSRRFKSVAASANEPTACSPRGPRRACAIRQTPNLGSLALPATFEEAKYFRVIRGCHGPRLCAPSPSAAKMPQPRATLGSLGARRYFFGGCAGGHPVHSLTFTRLRRARGYRQRAPGFAIFRFLLSSAFPIAPLAHVYPPPVGSRLQATRSGFCDFPISPVFRFSDRSTRSRYAQTFYSKLAGAEGHAWLTTPPLAHARGYAGNEPGASRGVPGNANGVHSPCLAQGETRTVNAGTRHRGNWDQGSAAHSHTP
jgi:hypothetical protein